MRDGRAAADRLLTPANALVAAAALAFLWLPVAVLAVFSFNDGNRPHVWTGFSTRWWSALPDHPDVRRTAGNSLAVAAATALVATALGTAVALALDRRSRRRDASRAGTAALDAAVTTPMLVPDLVQGVALLVAFATAFALCGRVLGAAPTFGRWTIVVAHVGFATSYVVLLVRARLRTIPRALEDAALDLGATPAQAFRRVTLPLLAPAVAGGALLAFTLSLDEYVLAFFTSGPGSDTLPVWIASAVRHGRATPVVNALSAALVAGSAALLALSVVLQRRRS